MKKNSELLEMFVLDVLRYDYESIDSIIKLLNDSEGVGWREFWPTDFSTEELIPALESLVKKEHVKPFYFDQTTQSLEKFDHPCFIEVVEQVWFGLTEEGRQHWEAWSPPE